MDVVECFVFSLRFDGVHHVRRVFFPPQPPIFLSRKSREAIVPDTRCRPRVHPRPTHILNQSIRYKISPCATDPHHLAARPFRDEREAPLADFILIPAKVKKKKQRLHRQHFTLEVFSEADAFTTTEALGALARIWVAWTALPTKTEEAAERAAILTERREENTEG